MAKRRTGILSFNSENVSLTLYPVCLIAKMTNKRGKDSACWVEKKRDCSGARAKAVSQDKKMVLP